MFKQIATANKDRTYAHTGMPSGPQNTGIAGGLPNFRPLPQVQPQVASPKPIGPQPTGTMPATTSELGLVNAQTPYPKINRTNVNAATPEFTRNGSSVAMPTASPRMNATTASAGGDFRDFEDRAYNNATERYLNPQWDRSKKDFDQQMIDRGIDIGTEAYNTAFDNFSRSKNDAYSKAAFDAMGYGRDTQNMQFGQSLANAQMKNQAGMANLNADVQRNALMAQIANNNANRDFSYDSMENQLAQANANRGLQADQFNANQSFQRDSLLNQLQQANANRSLQADQFNRNYDLNELSTLSNIDMGYNDRDFRDANFNAQRDDVAYNRLASILSGLQQTGTPQVDVQGAYNARQQQANANYQAASQNASNNMGGLMNLAGTAAMAYASDRRLKEDIKKVGDYGRLNVYEFKYIGDDTVHTGFMADEVKEIAPEAVVTMPNGYDAVYYDKAMEAA